MSVTGRHRRSHGAASLGVALLGSALLGNLAGCVDEDVAQQRCVAPLVEIIRWRDDVENELRYRGLQMGPGELAGLERAHVQVAVDALAAERTRCAVTWSVLLMQPPDNPALRLREEAILTLTGAPLRAYPMEAVGAAGVSLDGSAPLAMPPAQPPPTPAVSPPASPSTGAP